MPATAVKHLCQQVWCLSLPQSLGSHKTSPAAGCNHEPKMSLAFAPLCTHCIFQKSALMQAVPSTIPFTQSWNRSCNP